MYPVRCWQGLIHTRRHFRRHVRGVFSRQAQQHGWRNHVRCLYRGNIFKCRRECVQQLRGREVQRRSQCKCLLRVSGGHVFFSGRRLVLRGVSDWQVVRGYGQQFGICVCCLCEWQVCRPSGQQPMPRLFCGILRICAGIVCVSSMPAWDISRSCELLRLLLVRCGQVSSGRGATNRYVPGVRRRHIRLAARRLSVPAV